MLLKGTFRRGPAGERRDRGEVGQRQCEGGVPERREVEVPLMRAAEQAVREPLHDRGAAQDVHVPRVGLARLLGCGPGQLLELANDLAVPRQLRHAVPAHGDVHLADDGVGDGDNGGRGRPRHRECEVHLYGAEVHDDRGQVELNDLAGGLGARGGPWDADGRSADAVHQALRPKAQYFGERVAHSPLSALGQIKISASTVPGRARSCPRSRGQSLLCSPPPMWRAGCPGAAIGRAGSRRRWGRVCSRRWSCPGGRGGRSTACGGGRRVRRRSTALRSRSRPGGRTSRPGCDPRVS